MWAGGKGCVGCRRILVRGANTSLLPLAIALLAATMPEAVLGMEKSLTGA